NVMKSLSSRRIHRCSDGSATSCRVRPACEQSLNEARQLCTEFIDIGRNVVIMRSGLGSGALQALQFLKRFGEAGQGPCGAFGILRALRFSFELCAQILYRGELFQDSAVDAWH